MTKTISWPARAMYIALALTLAFSLAAVAISPSGVDAYTETQWSKVSTPSIDDFVIQPGTDVISFAASADGDVIYAVVDGILDDVSNHCDYLDDEFYNSENGYGNAVLKSKDGGVTWDDITDETQEEGLYYPMMVAIAPDDSDFVFVTGYGDEIDDDYDPEDNDDPWTDGEAYMVVGSDDGGDDFSDMVFDAVAEEEEVILCIAVSPEIDGDYEVAIGTNKGTIWRYTVGGTFGGSWKDTTEYQGWDDDTFVIVALAFSPFFDADDTIVGIVGSSMPGYDATFQISGIWGTTKAWNAEAGSPFTAPVEIIDAPPFCDDGLSLSGSYPSDYDEWDHPAGIAMPADFTGYDSGMRYNWIYVNYDATESDGDVPESFANEFEEVGQVFRVKGSSVDYAGICCTPWDTSASYPLMASITMYGEIDDGNIMVGLQGPTDCCDGINVYRTSEWPIDLCCTQWSGASKKPTGQTNALVQYVDDGNKGYAVTSSDLDQEDYHDESAFSVSEVDDIGKFWNQPSLVDSTIDFLSDMAVNPSCGTIYIFAINECEDDCACDSVWMSTDDGDSYLRVFCKALENDFGLIRTAPEEEDEILTVYLVDQGTKDLWWNDDSGYTKWESRKASTLDSIYDLAVESEDTIYALEGMYADDADVSMSDKHGGPGSWSSAKDSKVDVGWSIVVRDGHVLVGGYESGKVGFSDDSASSFSKLDDIGDGTVTCAFDTYYDQNDYVYAAVWGDMGDDGVYRTTVADGDFSDMDAPDMGGYIGVVTELSKSGNPKTTSTTGGVLYALGWDGMARQLTPAASTCCGDLSWDWLDAKLDLNCAFGAWEQSPQPLKICGCLTPSSDTHLWAIDECCYDMDGGDSSGSPWVYRDCFSKAGPTLTAVPDGSVVAAGDCACGNEVFNLAWERLCNECEYEFDISLDDSFTKIVVNEQDFPTFIGDGGFYDPPKNTAPSVVIGEGVLDCNQEYFWRVRTRWSDKPELIRSWWSDTWSFTVESCAALGLTAPDDGASNLPLEGIGFTWQAVDDASYDFTLSANSDLSSPIASETGISGTAYAFDGKLDYSTTYFWTVVAMDGSNIIAESDVSTFTTRPEPSEPPALPEYPEYPDYPEPVQPTTPGWVWAVIAIGAVLVIVIIVLIFRTRRV